MEMKSMKSQLRRDDSGVQPSRATRAGCLSLAEKRHDNAATSSTSDNDFASIVFTRVAVSL